jgi:hypothetical protein
MRVGRCILLLSFRNYILNRTVTLSEDSSSRDSMQGDPIIAAPTEHAPYRVQRKHSKQAIEGTQLGRFELDGVAAWALAFDPKKFRHPIGPAPGCITHSANSFLMLFRTNDL